MICDIHYNKHFRTYYRAKKAFDDYVMQIFSGLSTYAWISHIRKFKRKRIWYTVAKYVNYVHFRSYLTSTISFWEKKLCHVVKNFQIVPKGFQMSALETFGSQLCRLGCSESPSVLRGFWLKQIWNAT